MISLQPLPASTQSWLLDPQDPGARYLALRKLSSAPAPALSAAAEEAHRKGQIAIVLDHMRPEAYWEQDGPGYLPKYRSAVWSLILLAQLGASVDHDPRIASACRSYLDRALAEGGQISSNGNPSGTVDCLQGNMLSALQDLGFEDQRLEMAWEWLARSLTGEGVAPMGAKKAPLRYYSGKIGPDFQCGANNKLACAWGGTKVMLAFSKLPLQRRTPLIEGAIQRGLEFFFSLDPAGAEYPSGWNTKPSRNWWKFGFPVFYVTDILQICEALVRLGQGRDPRLERALELIAGKGDAQSRWALEYDYAGKTWGDYGQKNAPSKWVTIRALEVFRLLEGAPLIKL